MAFKVKCMVCRNTGIGDTINDALFNIIHNDNCDYNKVGRMVKFDSIDLSKAENF